MNIKSFNYYIIKMQKLNQTRDLMEGVENIAFKAQNGIINKWRDSLQWKSLLADSKGDKEVIFISSPKCQEEVEIKQKDN